MCKNRQIFVGSLFCLLFSFCLNAFSLSDREFDQGKMLTSPYGILVLSACEATDVITAYDTQGKLLWNMLLSSKIISWQMKEGRLYVFSKDRYYEDTYLMCVHPATGSVQWERP